MPTTIHLETLIDAPMEVCFDLSRSIDLHQYSTRHTDERAVAGRTSRLIELNETVTWEATHFWIRQRLSSKITTLERPSLFTDVMIDGAFKSLHHDHIFDRIGGTTKMTDNLIYEVPGEIIGTIFDILILRQYMKRLLIQRNQTIKTIAESGQYKEFFP